MQSLSLSGLAATRKSQPVFDLAASLVDMKARVSAIPVFTVANKDNEFVLVSGEVSCTCKREQLHSA